jgi:transcription elongation factor Elf1
MKCPYCNTVMGSMVLACNPPIYRDECPKCGARHDNRAPVIVEEFETWTPPTKPLNDGYDFTKSDDREET